MFGLVKHGSKRGAGFSNVRNAQRDAICVDEGGTGFVYAVIPGDGWKGWFTGHNLGEPFNGALKQRVEARLKAAGL